MGCLSSSSKKERSPSQPTLAAVPDSPPSGTTTRGPPDADGERMGYGAMIRQLYEALVCSIIRPPRANYSLRDLGPVAFVYGGRQHRRRDFQLTNGRGQRLECSHWEPEPTCRPAARLPCVVYLHGNSSSRAEAMDVLAACLAAGITVVALDFAGSGLSEGDYVSLGHYERRDLETVVEHLRADEGVAGVAAWGHSMGAVTALLHAADHLNGVSSLALAGIVVDSAFTELEGLAQELVRDGKLLPVAVPGLVVTGAMRIIRNTVLKRAEFDLRQLAPIKTVHRCTTPAYFGHGSQDEFIVPRHSEQLKDKYGGPSELMLFDGDHNSPRPAAFLTAAVAFLIQAMSASPDLALPSPPARRPRLPWAPSSSRSTAAAAAALAAGSGDAADADDLLALRGRGANNTIQQQLEQQAAADTRKRDADVIAKLVELGFPEDSAREASTQHKTVEGAVAHLLEAR